MFWPTQPKQSMFRLRSTEEEHLDQVRQKSFRPVRPKKNVSTEFDQEALFDEKNVDRDKSFRLCSTEEKLFDWVWPRVFWTEKFSTDQKKFDSARLREYVSTLKKNDCNWPPSRFRTLEKFTVEKKLDICMIGCEYECSYLDMYL